MSAKCVFFEGYTRIAEGQQSIGRAVGNRILQTLWTTPKIKTLYKLEQNEKNGTHQQSWNTPTKLDYFEKL